MQVELILSELKVTASGINPRMNKRMVSVLRIFNQSRRTQFNTTAVDAAFSVPRLARSRIRYRCNASNRVYLSYNFCM